MQRLWCNICRKRGLWKIIFLPIKLKNAQTVMQYLQYVRLKWHVSSAHENKCPNCNAIFSENISLKGHILSVYEKNKY